MQMMLWYLFIYLFYGMDLSVFFCQTYNQFLIQLGLFYFRDFVVKYRKKTKVFLTFTGK